MPCPVQPVVVEPERGQRLAQVEVGLARGDQADPARRPAPVIRVEAAAADVLEGDGQPGELLAALELGQLGAEQVRGRPVARRRQAVRQVRQIGGLPAA